MAWAEGFGGVLLGTRAAFFRAASVMSSLTPALLVFCSA